MSPSDLTAYAHRVAGDVLLLVSVLSLVTAHGTLRWQAPPSHPDLLGLWVPLPGVEEDCQELGVTDTSATFVVVRFTGATVAGKEVEWWVLLQVRDGVTGPTFTAAQFSGAISTTVTRRLESFLPPTLLLLCSLRLWAQIPWLGRQSSIVCILCCSQVLPLLCVPVHLHLGIQMCGTFLHPGELNAGNFFEF